MKQIQRIFYPGDKWLYFKIYTGIKTADNILIFALFPLLKKLMKEKKISKCFFIRYTDPGFHIRFRILVPDKNDTGYIINLWHSKLKKYCDDTLINRIDISTYSRELERYGEHTMELSESVFSIDSECILSILNLLLKKDDNLRWMIALRMIDAFFNDIDYGLKEKAAYIEKMSEGYKMEFGYNMYNAKQLNAIYREKRGAIVSVLSATQENADMLEAINIIKKRSKKIRRLIKEEGKLPDNNISSYIHMMMNRLFRTKNRIHELLIYDFLSRYYKSEMAKLKSKDE